MLHCHLTVTSDWDVGSRKGFQTWYQTRADSQPAPNETLGRVGWVQGEAEPLLWPRPPLQEHKHRKVCLSEIFKLGDKHK